MDTRQLNETLEEDIISDRIIEQVNSTATDMLIIDITELDGDFPRGVIRYCHYDISIEFDGWLELIFRIEYICNLFNRPMKTHEMRTLLPKIEEPPVFLSMEERIEAQKQAVKEKMNKIKSLQGSSSPAQVGQLLTSTTQQKRIATFALRIRYRQNSSWQGDFRCKKSENIARFRSMLELMHYMSEALGLNPLGILE